MRSIQLLASTLALRAAAVLVPLEPRASDPSIPAKPACTANSDVIVNGAFYTTNGQDLTYDPWKVTPGSGSPNCQYTNNYELCHFDGPGGYDPECFKCEYGAGGGSTTISQKITFAPGCEYTVMPDAETPHRTTRATIGCSAHNTTSYGAPHIFFQVFLDQTSIIPPQYTCSPCASRSSDEECGSDVSRPTYKTVSGKIVAPALGSGTLRVYTNQAAQAGTVAALLITGVRMVAPGTV